MDLTPFKRLIKEKTGLSFGDSRSVKLAEVIQDVMSAKGIHSSAEFYNLILSSQREFVDMVNLLTINETYFFREPVHLKILSERLVPELFRRRRTGAKIRILSAGCSTGEEPYSLVMALMERMGLRIGAQFEIMGVDIDSDAIYRAKKGIYGNQSFRGFDQKLKSKYFDKMGDTQFKLKDFVKEMVDLRVFNLSSDLYPEYLCNLDVIFYRNVSIYFEQDTQKKIFGNLSRTLNNGGYFITSATETLSHNLNILSLTELDGTFFYQKATGPAADEIGTRLRSKGDRTRLAQKRCPFGDLAGGIDSRLERATVTFPCKPLFSPSVPSEERMKVPSAIGVECEIEPQREKSRQKSLEESFEEALALAEDKRYDQAIERINELTACEPSFVRAHTLKGNLLINLERIEEAERACLKAVEIDELCLEGYLLLGLIAKKNEDHTTSVRRFKEALYVRPSCWLAHFYLAEIHHSRGELDKARREYTIILKLSERGELKDPGLSFFPLTVPIEQMMHLCRHKLACLEAV